MGTLIGMNIWIGLFSKKKGDFLKAQIILYLYFKELKSDFIKLHNAVLEMNRHINEEIKSIYLSSGDIKIYRNVHNQKIIEANTCMDKIKEHMHKMAMQI